MLSLDGTTLRIFQRGAALALFCLACSGAEFQNGSFELGTVPPKWWRDVTGGEHEYARLDRSAIQR
jgi:hypothetical protein